MKPTMRNHEWVFHLLRNPSGVPLNEPVGLVNPSGVIVWGLSFNAGNVVRQ